MRTLGALIKVLLESTFTEMKSRQMTRQCIVALGLLLGCAQGYSQQQFTIVPPQPKSTFIVGTVWDPHRYHVAAGDTWPLTWASDGNLYGAAGDNSVAR
jgi:hypothetical protein